nr:hypothetical protein [Sulfurivermis fontis]
MAQAAGIAHGEQGGQVAAQDEFILITQCRAEDVVGQFRRQRGWPHLGGIGEADDAVHPEGIVAAAHLAEQQAAALRVEHIAAEAVAQVDDGHRAVAVMEQAGAAGIGTGDGGDVFRQRQDAGHRQGRHGTGDTADTEDQPVRRCPGG